MCTYLGAGAELDTSYIDEARRSRRPRSRTSRATSGTRPRRRKRSGTPPRSRTAPTAGSRSRSPIRSASSATAPSSVELDRGRHRHPLRQRGRDHVALRGRDVRRGAAPRARALRDRGAHPRRARLGDRRRRRRARHRRRSPSRSSTRPARATSTRPGSSTASRTATTSRRAAGSRRSRAAEVISHLGARPAQSPRRARPPAARSLTGAWRDSRGIAPAIPSSIDDIADLIAQGRRRPRRRPRLRDDRVGGAPRARPRVARRPEDRQRRAEGDALRVRGLRAVPRRPQGRDLRLGAHAPRRPAVRADRRARPRARRGRLDGDHRRGPGDHGSRHRGRGRGELVRREHPAAVRGGDHAVPRRRPEARQLPLLLHAQGHVREGGARVRAAARRLRHARRGLRAAHARADGQGAARADRPARRSRRHVLADAGCSSSSGSCARAATSRPRTSSS